MIRQVAFAGVVVACIAGMMMGCSKKDNPAGPQRQRTVLFTEGFEGDLSNWKTEYLINYGDPTYPRMRITTDTAHAGTHSITGDSNMTALEYDVPDTNHIDTLIAGIQFYIMATAKGQANFTVAIGQNNGSSGGLGKAFGIGFDMSDSVKCSYYDSWSGHSDTMIAPIQLNKWYKCVVEVDMDAKIITYSLDDVKVRTVPLPSIEWSWVDRVLVLRGLGDYDQNGSLIQIVDNAPKQYYADDIVLYKR
jgi:hypothetical protein